MKADEKRLKELYRELTEEQQQTVLAFLEFLASRGKPEVPAIPLEPQHVPRPAQESVVSAIKRLRATYAMLDHGKLLHEISGFMTQHVVHGKAAPEIIDEMEVVFARHYEQFRKP